MNEAPNLPVRSVWGQLPTSHRRWIAFKAVIAGVVINLILNALIDSRGVSGLDQVQVWGGPMDETSFFWSAILTLFLLPLITCALVTTAIWRDVRLGSLEPLEQLRKTHRWLTALPPTRLRRGIVFGALAVIAFAPPLVLALLLADVSELTRQQYVVWHTALAVVLGAIVTPVIALYAMVDPSE